MTKPARLPTHVPGLDDVLGGFLSGDNIILENTVGAPPHGLLEAIVRGGVQRGDQVIYVSFDATPASLRQRFGDTPEVALVDCFTHGLGKTRSTKADTAGLAVHDPQFPAEFQHAMDALPRTGPRRTLVFDSLNGMAMLWGEPRVAEYYAQTCPALFDQGDLAVWVLHEGVQSPKFHSQIGHIAQVILRLDRSPAGPSVAVTRAVGRPSLPLGAAHSYEEAKGFRIARSKGV